MKDCNEGTMPIQNEIKRQIRFRYRSKTNVFLDDNALQWAFYVQTTVIHVV